MADMLRLDVALVTRGLVESRSRGGQMIEKGYVLVNGNVCQKSSCKVSSTDQIVVEQQERFVSRGGYKLLKALETFPIDFKHQVCLDVGASTGGFTHCMLQFGAAKVYAVDVGTNQLSPLLREDPRVVVREQCNFRYVTHEHIPDAIDFAGADVSFISLSHILPPLQALLRDGGQAVCLIKPQFEAGKAHVGKNGVVKDLSVHNDVIQRIVALATHTGFSVLGLTFSPIKGPQGNIEYLIWLQKSATPTVDHSVNALNTVQTAHQKLDGENL